MTEDRARLELPNRNGHGLRLMPAPKAQAVPPQEDLPPEDEQGHQPPPGTRSQSTSAHGVANETVRGVGGVLPLPLKGSKVFLWKVEKGVKKNGCRLGRLLSRVRPDLYRNGSTGYGLLLIRADGTTRRIRKAAQLSPILADSINMRVAKEGKILREMPCASILNTILESAPLLHSLWFYHGADTGEMAQATCPSISPTST